MKLAFVLGTRPEIIKLAPIINKLKKSQNSVIFTGQHYDYDMSIRFIRELGLRKPDYKMNLTRLQNNTTDRATQTGEIIIKLSKILSEIKPDAVVVQGDTNTVLAASITSIKCGIPIGHVESGLRSHDWRMPEEHNRIAVDHISEWLFAPTITSKKNLMNEKVHGKIHITGNTSIDTIKENIKKIEKNKTLDSIDYDFILATIHRGENVDDKKTLFSIIQSLLESPLKVILPVHPRTMLRLKQYGLIGKIKHSKTLSIIPPVGYFDMLYLLKKCNFVISDSGGIQEEATSPVIRKKVLITRITTDRPETVDMGFSKLVGIKKHDISKSIIQTIDNPKIKSASSPYGNGNSSSKILKILKNQLS